MASMQEERETASHTGNTLEDFNSDSSIGRLTDNGRLYIEGHDEVSVVVSTVSSSSTGNSQTNENQEIYADEDSARSENLPSKDIYVAKNNEAENAVAYQTEDTCREEASVNAYECGGDVDDVTENNATDTDIDGTQPENVLNRLEDDAESVHDVWTCISPYAVAYSQYGLTAAERTDQRRHDDIYQPYAVVYEEQDGPTAHQASTSRRRSVPNAQGVSTNAAFPSTSSDADGDRKDGLTSNPMYVPNVPQPKAAGGRTFNLSWTQIACIGAIHLVVGALIVSAIAFPLIFTVKDQHEDTDMETISPDPVTEKTTIQSTTPVGTHPTWHMYSVPYSSTSAGVGDKESEPMRVEFGETGKAPGEFCGPNGVVVSPRNEIFVTDKHNRRVQVFNMKGAYLRQFPTVVSENQLDTMKPECIAIDADCHLWVVGKNNLSYAYVVQYTKTGHRTRTIQPSFPNNTVHGVAVNAHRKHVIVAETWKDYATIKVLLFNGTVVRTFGKFNGYMPIRVATDTHGNILVSDWDRGPRVRVYDETGQYLFSIGRKGQDPPFGPIASPVAGLCADKLGQFLLAFGEDRSCTLFACLELYTARGDYMRPIATNLTSAYGVAVGPDGQLVVASWSDDLVVVLPDY
ncbi:zinc ion binding [Branchiostoma belcheri]|nr:zinc ion binding [Branchiostoma belcheri]